METGDLCPHCLRPSCAGDAITCPRRFDLMSPQAIAKARAVDAAPSNAVFGDGRGVISAACKFCQDEGGYGCACHGCGRVGTRVRL